MLVGLTAPLAAAACTSTAKCQSAFGAAFRRVCRQVDRYMLHRLYTGSHMQLGRWIDGWTQVHALCCVRPRGVHGQISERTQHAHTHTHIHISTSLSLSLAESPAAGCHHSSPGGNRAMKTAGGEAASWEKGPSENNSPSVFSCFAAILHQTQQRTCATRQREIR